MEQIFIETPTQDPNEESSMDIENPMLAIIVRILHFRKIMYSVLVIAEHTFSPLLIVTTICI
jgi:hypothetical protein